MITLAAEQPVFCTSKLFGINACVVKGLERLLHGGLVLAVGHAEPYGFAVQHVDRQIALVLRGMGQENDTADARAQELSLAFFQKIPYT